MYEILYSKITDALVGNGYIIIDNALDVSLSQGLSQFIKTQTGFKKAGISSSSSVHIDTNKRSDKILWIDDSGLQSEFLGFTKGLQEYLNRSLYLGLRRYESHFSVYEAGDFYEKHRDAFKNSKNRVVTTVYYLNENWDEQNGGELVIYDENDKRVQTVIPRANTLVVFLSEKFPHEVLKSKEKRYSVAGWYRID